MPKLFFLELIADFLKLISDLSKRAYMTGKSSGVESEMRDKAPRLLDIDGDACHHLHNSVKSFSKPFSKYIETFIDDVQFIDDVHTNLK